MKFSESIMKATHPRWNKSTLWNLLNSIENSMIDSKSAISLLMRWLRTHYLQSYFDAFRSPRVFVCFFFVWNGTATLSFIHPTTKSHTSFALSSVRGVCSFRFRSIANFPILILMETIFVSNFCSLQPCGRMVNEKRKRGRDRKRKKSHS